MGDAREPLPVTLIAGLLYADEMLAERARDLLIEQFGPIDRVSDEWPFEMTHYYEVEIGPRIRRRFVTFAEPFSMGALAGAKLATNDMEQRIAGESGCPPDRRPVNIDPGYVTLGSLVLATTKNRPHRIYLERGIFAEVTLQYESGGWRKCPWTYPDYAAATYHPFLLDVRDHLKRRRRAE